jgi:hypothetical protein
VLANEDYVTAFNMTSTQVAGHVAAHAGKAHQQLWLAGADAWPSGLEGNSAGFGRDTNR